MLAVNSCQLLIGVLNKQVSQLVAPLVAHHKPAEGLEQAAKCAERFWT